MKPSLLLLASLPLIAACEAPFTNGLLVEAADAGSHDDAPAAAFESEAPEASAGDDAGPPADARAHAQRDEGAEAMAREPDADPPDAGPEASPPDTATPPPVDAGHEAEAAPPPAVCCALSGSCTYVVTCASASGAAACHCDQGGACTPANLSTACWLSNGCATGTLQVCP
jgi:hypothetical protein